MPANYALTNDYNRCQLVNLDPEQSTAGPFAITQVAYDPEDARMAEAAFLLGKDGTWVDELALANVPRERQLDFFFGSSGEAMKAMSALTGKPVIERYALTEQDLRERVAARQAGGYLQRVNELVERFREARRKP
jgi:hypothetical protein